MLSTYLRTLACLCVMVTNISPTVGEPVAVPGDTVRSTMDIQHRLPRETGNGDGMQHKRVGFSNAEIIQLVQAHNRARENSEVPNMIPLVWDDTVAAKAQQDACQCKQAASSQEFRRTTEFGILAENRYTSEQWDEVSMPHSAVDELRREPMASEKIKSSATKVFGCGMSSCDTIERNQENHHYLFVCLYGPGLEPGMSGNMIGTFCTRCPPSYSAGCVEGLCQPNVPCSGYTCQNGGLVDEMNCVCGCPDGYYGAQCTGTLEPNQQCQTDTDDHHHHGKHDNAALVTCASLFLVLFATLLASII